VRARVACRLGTSGDPSPDIHEEPPRGTRRSCASRDAAVLRHSGKIPTLRTHAWNEEWELACTCADQGKVATSRRPHNEPEATLGSFRARSDGGCNTEIEGLLLRCAVGDDAQVLELASIGVRCSSKHVDKTSRVFEERQERIESEIRIRRYGISAKVLVEGRCVCRNGCADVTTLRINDECRIRRDECAHLLSYTHAISTVRLKVREVELIRGSMVSRGLNEEADPRRKASEITRKLLWQQFGYRVNPNAQRRADTLRGALNKP
jgi:hypothetical protein